MLEQSRSFRRPERGARVSALPPAFRSARTTDQCRSTTPGPWIVYEFPELLQHSMGDR